MNPATYEELKSLLYKLNSEKADIQKQIDDNTLQIIEARSFAKEILDREEEDFKVFSPRKIEDIYKDELHKSNVKQTDCENRNQVLFAKRQELDSIISVLEKVVEEIAMERLEKSVEQNSDEISNKTSSEESGHQNTMEHDITESNAIEPVTTEPDLTKEIICKTIKNLNHLTHKIELSTKFIHQDPMRTKIELETVNKSIKKITNKLGSIMEEDE